MQMEEDMNFIKKHFKATVIYLAGLAILALGTALMEAADFGMSMVVAPAYLIYLKLSETYSFITFGIAEYITQALLLIAMMLVLRKFKVKYLFAFVTTLIYGQLLDGCMWLIALVSPDTTAIRLIYFLIGMIVCALGVALLFCTYLPPEVYELFVKELSERYHFNISKCKTIYDITSCLIAVILSFCFFGLWHFEGVKLGTIFCALVNGWIIGRWLTLLKKCNLSK